MSCEDRALILVISSIFELDKSTEANAIKKNVGPLTFQQNVMCISGEMGLGKEVRLEKIVLLNRRTEGRFLKL